MSVWFDWWMVRHPKDHSFQGNGVLLGLFLSGCVMVHIILNPMLFKCTMHFFCVLLGSYDCMNVMVLIIFVYVCVCVMNSILAE